MEENKTSKENLTTNVETHKIYRYKDLSFGKLCSVNREIKPQHVTNIFHGLENGTWDRLDTIIVDIETREILDGNHRYSALLKYIDKYGDLGGNLIDVKYKKRRDGQSLADAIREYNDDRKALSIKDYSYLRLCDGNTAIAKIRDFGLSHKLTAKINKKTQQAVGYSERYVYAFVYGKNMTKEVKNGTIEVSKKQMDDAETLYKEVEDMILKTQLSISYWLEQFIQAWYEVRINDRLFINQFNKISFEDFSKQIVDDSKNWQMDKVKKSDWVLRFNSALADLVK